MNKLLSYISFTKSELKVIVFIVTVLVAGFSVKYYRHLTTENFDYTVSDAEFKKLSEKIYQGSKRNGVDSTKSKLTKESVTVNLNTATKSELIELPGIGESTADKIIIYRQDRNGFKKIEELMNISGIGKKKFEKIKTLISTK